MGRRLEDAIAAAADRGAIVSAGAADQWRDYADEHGDQAAAEWLDALPGSQAPAEPDAPARRPRGAWATTGASRTVAARRGPVTPPGGRRLGDGDRALFAANPLLDEATADRPGLVSAALAEGPEPPRLFGDADLPPFTASGLDPSALARLPWPLRRPVAEAPTLAAAYALITRYEGSPEMARVDLAGGPLNAGYRSAFSAWLAGRGEAGIRAANKAAAEAATGEEVDGPGEYLPDYTVESIHQELFGGRTYAAPESETPAPWATAAYAAAAAGKARRRDG